MTQYLLDTNVVLRFSNPSDQQHGLVLDCVAILLRQANECYLTAQVLIEFWVVATRPVDVNGLGWSVSYTRNILDQLLVRFPMAEETPHIFSHWLNLVTEHQIQGKRTHDARIVSVMLACGINHILTLNPADFANISNITVVHPQTIIDAY
ncbi:type II toxin-antitoxin system VapC family toxin [Spirulina sp. CCNP1310]|uniref:type II toxin-antitoxin system VapC family toxin n=1 Tax=Spirulina sp. CCNP1310 TaxID=3110249 RepID=UPI002B207C98|nr:type II toxin-antitoxin system VapC family toxin [Spirulina sp. CCNP1310]MEA5419138.1 type II toxin-antitoxin system VapC family toxin [Spirulina sp. CCNP1310]